MKKDLININVTNNTNGLIPVSILGNFTDAMDTANATTQYSWNITGFTITVEQTVTITYRPTNDPNYINVSAPIVTQTLQGVIDALNTLNLGAFFITTSGGSTFINNYNENIVFQQLDIYNSTPSILFDFYQQAYYDNADTTVADLSGNGNFGVPVLGSGNGVPTTLAHYATIPFGELTIPSFALGLQYSVRLNNLAKFGGLAPYTIMAWFNNTGLHFEISNRNQGIIAAEGRNGIIPIGYSFYIGLDLGLINITHERWDMSTGTLARLRLNFTTSIVPAFAFNAYYFVCAGFDGTNMYISIYANDGVRYDNSMANVFSLDTSAFYSAFLGLRYANWLNGAVQYASVYSTWTGLALFDNIYNATKARYGY